jgi:hypothetical protein
MIFRSPIFISSSQNPKPYSLAAERSQKQRNNQNGINTPKKKELKNGSKMDLHMILPFRSRLRVGVGNLKRMSSNNSLLCRKNKLVEIHFKMQIKKKNLEFINRNLKSQKIVREMQPINDPLLCCSFFLHSLVTLFYY